VAENKDARKTAAILSITAALVLTAAALHGAITTADARPVLADAEVADPSEPDPSIDGAPNEASGEDLYGRSGQTARHPTARFLRSHLRKPAAKAQIKDWSGKEPK
jgi:hypothetical protein